MIALGEPVFNVIEDGHNYEDYKNPNKRPEYVPEFDTIKKLQPGQSVLIENGCTGKNPNRNWKPYHYGNRYGKSKGWRIRAVTIDGGHLRIWRLK